MTSRALLSGLLLVALSVHADDVEPTQIDWYGFMRLDMAHDSAASTPGNYALFVQPHLRDQSTSTLNITGRQSRVGGRIQRGTMRGRLEVDFYGSSPENKNTVQLRYAVFEVPLGGWILEAGQTSDLISPLVPSTVNYSVAWGAGNVGYRRPQVKLLRRGTVIDVGLSLARNITGDLDGDTILDGSASAVPAVQARCALKASGTTIGLSAHYGKCNCPAKDIDYNNWSVNVDAAATLGDVTLMGEGYRGSNMGPYAGAVYNSDRVHGVHSQGGWVNLQLRRARWKLTVGTGLDDVDSDDLLEARVVEDGSVEQPGTDLRTANQVAWLGSFYDLTPEVVLGLELSRWATTYRLRTADMERQPTNLRLQWSLQANF